MEVCSIRGCAHCVDGRWACARIGIGRCIDSWAYVLARGVGDASSESCDFLGGLSWEETFERPVGGDVDASPESHPGRPPNVDAKRVAIEDLEECGQVDSDVCASVAVVSVVVVK